MIKTTGGRQPENSWNDPLGSPCLYYSLGKQIIRSLPITSWGETVPTVNRIQKMAEWWQSQCWLNEARRRNWKRILFLVPGKTWNLCDPHSGSNTQNSISDFSYEQKTVSRELDEHGVSEDYVDRYLIRKQKERGVSKPAAHTDCRHPLRTNCTCQIPTSKLEGSELFRYSTHCSCGLSLHVPSVL